MQPVSPVVPGHEASEVVWAKNQTPYLPLPALPCEDGHVSRWQLSWRERLTILWTGSLYIWMLTFGQRPQPIKPTVERPTFEALEEGEKP